MDTGIIVDTCVWINFFRKSESKLALHLKTLLRKCKVIMAEILQGVNAPKEANLVKQSLGKLSYLEITRDTWEAAGEISASLQGAGITIPLSDLIIACVALSEDHEIFTIDPHFEKVDGLRLYNVS